MDKPKLVLVLTLLVGASIYLVGPAVTAETPRQVIIKGALLSEECMVNGKTSACYLELYHNPLVLLTGTRQMYNLKPNGVAQWKLDSAFGKQVVIKGTLNGKEILVTDVVALGGKKKLSKACL